jgi:hypothetical protein
MFSPEFAAMPDELAVSMLAVLDVAASFEGYHLMLDDQKLTKEQIAHALTATLLRLLAPAPGSP